MEAFETEGIGSDEATHIIDSILRTLKYGLDKLNHEIFDEIREEEIDLEENSSA